MNSGNGQFYALDKILNLHDGYLRPFDFAGHALLLAQSEGDVYLVRNSCPHNGWPLHSGSISEGKIFCEQHGCCFDLSTGAGAIANPCPGILTRYSLEYRGDIVGVLL